MAKLCSNGFSMKLNWILYDKYNWLIFLNVHDTFSDDAAYFSISCVCSFFCIYFV